MRNAELDEAQDGIKVAERNINNLRYTDDHLMLSSSYLQMLAYKMHKNADVGNLIPGFSDFSKTSLNIWKFMVHVLLKPGLKIFEHSFTSRWDECICAVVWAFFAIAFLWDWNENSPTMQAGSIVSTPSPDLLFVNLWWWPFWLVWSDKSLYFWFAFL